MAIDVVMPQMGESIFEGTITKWLKKPGDTVNRDEPLFEISTDKVDAEIPAPASGVLKEIKAQAGQTLQVNAVVAVIDDGLAPVAGSGAAALPASTPASAAAAAPSAPAPAAAPGVSGPATDVVMPQMGESIFEGTITKWLKKVGDTVNRDEPLFEISTDKVDAEIPAPASGVLTAIKAEAGQTVQVNAVVAVIGGPASAAGSVALPAPAPAAGSAALTVSSPAAATPAPVAAGEDVRSSPLVRKLASENNVDLRQVPGTGTGGRVTKDDILAFIERSKSAPAPVAAPAPVPTAPAPAAPSKFAGTPGVVEPMSVMRKKIAEHMIASRRTSAHVHTVFDVDMTRIVRLREKNKSRFQQETGLKLTYTPFFIRAVTRGLRAWPILNSSVEGENIHYKRDINIGIAVALDWGLLVPVIRHADELSFTGLQRALNDLGERARTKKLKPDEVQGGTFTITNPGIFGASFGLPIINQPQVAILDIGNIVKKPVVLTDKEGNDTIAIRNMLTIAIGFDHRIIDGAVADQFMMVVKGVLENWNEAL
ncbi:MAG: 2-oxoglutarate dehydrogenase, E2 component, dihydrolipoamide succinyltransferase [Acidobacteriota bacterium]|nr:2-oxoglutarate dehydrogenase, E2 component, dihydrolipoamide succinyltransferase [Acidobacteriota bacterium]